MEIARESEGKAPPMINTTTKSQEASQPGLGRLLSGALIAAVDMPQYQRSQDHEG